MTHDLLITMNDSRLYKSDRFILNITNMQYICEDNNVISNYKKNNKMTNIDWRAFWTSLATIIVALIIYAIVIEPIVKKYKIQVVKEVA